MNKSFYLILVLATLGLFAFQPVQEVTNYEVLTQKSTLKWVARKVGGMHEGITPIKSGSFTTSGIQITSGDFVVDMTKLELTDTESNKLTKHLRSADFFDVENHPETKLKITSSEVIDAENIKVLGQLTIRGKTQPITFDAVVMGQTENFISYKAKIIIDRTKYGITYRSSLGDAFIMDEFDVNVKITAKKV